MKKIALLIFLCFLGYTQSKAQTFENGLTLYEQGDYERAIRILSQSKEPQALLFVGKSHFALNDYLQALNSLEKITNNAPIDVYHDAKFTIALSNFQLRNFTSSLSILRELVDARPSTEISRSASVLYDQILNYLTLKQRKNVFFNSRNDRVKIDLLEASIGRINYPSAKALLSLYKRSVNNIDDLKLSRLEAVLSDSITYSQRFNPDQKITPPKGLSYNIGVTLPEFDYNSPEYEIAQHLYFGIQLAIEEFNSVNPDVKAFITYQNSNNGISRAEEVVTDLVWNKNVDVIIGPLFSEVAKSFSIVAQEYEVPLLLPLANSDNLDLFNNYVFQLNPSFSTQGKLMARKAVTELGYDTLGVIVEANSLGAPAARAFRHEAERLGGFVTYYFEENLEETGYDIRDYTQFFTTDTLDSVAIVEAVYAPFTGSVAPTLVESMLTDLEAMRSEVAILGSEEWQNVNLDDRRLSETDLYFTESFKVDSASNPSRIFRSSFRLRFGSSPNDFAYYGYDAANVILKTLKEVGNPSGLRNALKDLNNFRGLSTKVSFRGTHVNEEVTIRKMIRDSENLDIETTEFRKR